MTSAPWAGYQLLSRLSGWEPPPQRWIAERPYHSWLVVGTTCIGAFIGQLDASIVQLAMPTLEHDFDAPLTAVSWVAISYQVTFASILPVYARLAEVAGRKVMYLVGFALFALASLLCGLATNLPELIAFRILLGIGGAMLGANSVVILVKAAGRERRGRAMGIFSAAQAIGVSLGPVTGGVLLDALGWRWVFWISVPFALAGALAAWLIVPQTHDVGTDRRFDWRGALLLMPALAALLLLTSEFFAWGPGSTAIVGSAIATIALLSVFVRQERQQPAPLIDLDLFRVPSFTAGVIAIVISYAMLYGMFFVMSFALVRGYHDGPTAAGLRLAIIPVALGLVAPFSGAIHERLGGRAVLLGGMAICTGALILLAVVLTGEASSIPLVMLALAVFGAGLGTFIAPNNSLTMGAAPENRSGEAGGLLNLMRVLGTSIGVACGTAVLTGISSSTLGVPEQDLLRQVVYGLLLLACLGGVAGLTALFRAPPAVAVS